MKQRPVKLPDPSTIDGKVPLLGWSIDDAGLALTVFIPAADERPGMRVFSGETDQAVHVLVVRPVDGIEVGYADEIPEPVALQVQLEHRLGARTVIDASTGKFLLAGRPIA